MKTKWSDGVAIRGQKVYIRAEVKGDKEMGPATNYIHLLQPHEAVPTTITDGKRLRARVVEWILKGRPAPAPPPAPEEPIVELTGNDLFDRWLAAVQPFNPHGKKKSVVQNWNSKLKSARAAFGDTTLTALAQKATITTYVNAQLAAGLKLATPQRILATIVRPAVLWGNAIKLVDGNPFGKYGYKIDLSKEDRRTNRIDPALEYELLDVCGILGDGGRVLADFLMLAIDTGGRHEYLELLNDDVDWHASKLRFRHTKNGETRYAPFNPHGRVAELLKRRRFAGPKAHVLARADGAAAITIYRTWVQAVCVIKHIPYVCTRADNGWVSKETMAAYKEHKLVPYLTRHEAATWWGEKKVSDESAKFLQGHRSQYDTHGRYMHAAYERARAELAEKVWPCEGERAQPATAQRKERA